MLFARRASLRKPERTQEGEPCHRHVQNQGFWSSWSSFNPSSCSLSHGDAGCLQLSIPLAATKQRHWDGLFPREVHHYCRHTVPLGARNSRQLTAVYKSLSGRAAALPEQEETSSAHRGVTVCGKTARGTAPGHSLLSSPLFSAGPAHASLSSKQTYNSPKQTYNSQGTLISPEQLMRPARPCKAGGESLTTLPGQGAKQNFPFPQAPLSTLQSRNSRGQDGGLHLHPWIYSLHGSFPPWNCAARISCQLSCPHWLPTLA